MVGQEVGIYGVFIGINNEPSITLPSSLHILNTLGHFNFVLLLFLHKAIPLTFGRYEIKVRVINCHISSHIIKR